MYNIYIVPFSTDSKQCCLLLLHQEIITIILPHLGQQPAKRTTYQHLDFNIPHNQQIPDMLWSMKQ